MPTRDLNFERPEEIEKTFSKSTGKDKKAQN
jgi:hypothetical protein